MQVTENVKSLWGSPIGYLWRYVATNERMWRGANRFESGGSAELRELIDFVRKSNSLSFKGMVQFTNLDQIQVKQKGRLEVLGGPDELLARHFSSNNLHIVVPLNGEIKDLQKQFAELLKARLVGQQEDQGVLLEELSEVGPFRITQFAGLDYEVIGKALDVWLRHKITVLQKQQGHKPERSKLYEIGEDLGASAVNNPVEGDSQEVIRAKRNSMKVIVSRMIDRAEAVHRNIERGVFPSYKTVEENAIKAAITTNQHPSAERMWLEHLQMAEQEILYWNRAANLSR